MSEALLSETESIDEIREIDESTYLKYIPLDASNIDLLRRTTDLSGRSFSNLTKNIYEIFQMS